VYHWRHW